MFANCDKAIHKDGIYEIDNSCIITNGMCTNDDKLVFILLALFLVK